MTDTLFRADAALTPLKAFQRKTVDYVFRRLYEDEDSVRQFLVADEVGLGKTMVARGVIARAIEHLWNRCERIDILYICSNQAIARQNINRLNVLGRPELELPTRMTLVPLRLRGDKGLQANKVNFVSLTPRTTFDLRSATGVQEERAFLLRLLENAVCDPNGLSNLLQVSARDGWKLTVETTTLDGIDTALIRRFREDVQGNAELWAELEALCRRFHRHHDSYPDDMVATRNEVVGRLRTRLSHACVAALQPDLIILDEFQRFADILHGEHDAARLARELFDYCVPTGSVARTLLLSATPYRMLTLSGDAPEEGNHHADFLATLGFLYGRERGKDIARILEDEMRAYRTALHGLPEDRGSVVAARQRVEDRLRRVMSRTERVSSTAERDAMVREVTVPVTVQPVDLRQATAVAAVARALEVPHVIEYWKSAPYLLNFMRHYALKRALHDTAESPSEALLQAMAQARPACLRRAALQRYEPLEPANGRMRALLEDVFRDGLDEWLWIPPSLPYYGDAPSARPTKALVFSSWSMVPEAIAALLSYEAERRMGVGLGGKQYFAKKKSPPLRFRAERGRQRDLRTMLLMYPSPCLAALADPLDVVAAHSAPLGLAEMRAALADRLRGTVTALERRAGSDDEDSAWIWAAPAVLDADAGSRATDWLRSDGGRVALAEDDGFTDHVRELADWAGRRDFGPLPHGILGLMVDVALGSPAVCALRALHRVAPELAWDDPQLLTAAARVAWGFRTLFNQHDAVALLRQDKDDGAGYWRRVLAYASEHNLQAVLDEYVHYLLESEGLAGYPPAERVLGLSKAMRAALSLRPSQIEVDNPRVKDGRIVCDTFQMRGRFAMRLAEYKDEEGATRVEGVRDAFNSPFRPFVLATTSVGQEGLDFHPYCYRVYHWNLPHNPVDLEQREGRVHRFKGHAIRLNLAHGHGEAVRGRGAAPFDPWAAMFAAAREAASVASDLVPYWLCEGPVKVERRLLILPFSREIRRLDWLKRSLTVYRLAFGQPRQDDLLDYLQTMLGRELAVTELDGFQIRLEPACVTEAVEPP